MQLKAGNPLAFYLSPDRDVDAMITAAAGQIIVRVKLP